jgi:hypothetical protein
MPEAQNRTAEFEEAKAVAEACRQAGHEQALSEFEVAKREAEQAHRDRYERARLAFDRVKADPSHPRYENAREALRAASRAGPDYRKAGDSLDAAIRQVDELYYEELARLSTDHGVSVSQLSSSADAVGYEAGSHPARTGHP